jgi:hypothetical protein
MDLWSGESDYEVNLCGIGQRTVTGSCEHVNQSIPSISVLFYVFPLGQYQKQ